MGYGIVLTKIDDVSFGVFPHGVGCIGCKRVLADPTTINRGSHLLFRRDTAYDRTVLIGDGSSRSRGDCGATHRGVQSLSLSFGYGHRANPGRGTVYRGVECRSVHSGVGCRSVCRAVVVVAGRCIDPLP